MSHWKRIVAYLFVFALNFASLGVEVRAGSTTKTEVYHTSPQFAPEPTDELLSQTNNTLIPIADNAYAGGFGAGMACTDIVTNALPANAVVADARIDVRIDHTWVGDLTLKLRSPAGAILTVLNRPGGAAPDDGSDALVGDSSNWNIGTSIGFGDGLGPEAETMGVAIADAQAICTDDGVCFHDPSPDTAVTPPAAFSGFRDTAARGTWTLCAGDGAAADLGNLRSWTLTMNFAIPFTAAPNLAIPDDGYAGGFGGVGQACSTIAVPAGPIVQGVFVSVDIGHTWVGDLTMKLQSPTGTIFTILNRPGSNAPDDGSGLVGEDSNWNGPLLFGDAFGPEAETMGSTLTTDQVVCTTDGICSYDPSPDTAVSPVSFAAAFNGQVSGGNWTLCVGDSSLGDFGTFRSWRINLIDHLVPTAAPASVSGRVFTPLGSTINKARVRLTSADGTEKTALTSGFGYYSFNDVSVGETYVISVDAKGYTFDTRTVSVADDITDFDFIGQPSLFLKQQE